ncbi:MFS transporter [Candidatus Roizmanbacteria bacterium]|nr:MFS transporter [Candidatus Roizmanbacteria bacterium]
MFKKIKQRLYIHLPALQMRNFRLYFFGQGISLVGTWLANVAEQWLIYPVLTSNRSLLGVISAFNLLPTAALVLFAGVVSDRVDRRRLVILVQSLFALISLVLAVLVFTGQIRVWHVMIAAIAGGILFAFDMPTRNSMVLDLVDKEHYPSALSLNAGIFHAARAIGPALAGFLIAIIGIAAAYFLNALSFLAVIISLLLIYLPFKKQHHHPSFINGLKEGFQYVKSYKVIAALLLNIMLVSLWLWPANTLLPVFANDVYHTGELGFGLLQSFSGLGSVIAAFGFYSLYQRTKNKYHLLVIPTFLGGVIMIFFAFAPTFPLALLFQFLGGIITGIVFSGVNTLMQVAVPSAIRGRIMSFFSLVVFGSMPIGALIDSLIIGRLGPRLTVAVSSGFLILTAGVFYRLAGQKFQQKISAITAA